MYDRCMARVRTNLVIEDDYVDVIRARYDLRSKTEAVDLALRALAGRPATLEEALVMEGARAIVEVPEDRGPAGT